MQSLKARASVALAILASVSLLVHDVAAQAYPEKPVSVVMAMSPGGSSDRIFRALAPALEDALKAPVVMQYKPGAGGSIAYEGVSREKPDGYTIGQFGNSIFINQYGKDGGMKIDNVDFIANVAWTDYCLAVRGDSPYKTFKELVDYSKKNPALVTVSNSGLAAHGHLFSLGLAQKAGVDWTHVPMSGESTAVVILLGGHVTAVSVSCGLVAEQVAAGKVRILAIATPERSVMFKDVPTLKEMGIDFTYGGLVGVYGPKGIPEARKKALSEAIGKAVQAPKFQELLAQLGFKVMFYDYQQVNTVAKAEDDKMRELSKLVKY